MIDMAKRLGRPVTWLKEDGVAEWVGSQTMPVVTPWAAVGPTASVIESLGLMAIRRPWDTAIWPHASKGFFQLRRLLPELLSQAA
jgi:deoxyribodipyrimidine photo-lyase